MVLSGQYRQNNEWESHEKELSQNRKARDQSQEKRIKGWQGQRQEETRKAVVDLLPWWNADGMIYELFHTGLL